MAFGFSKTRLSPIAIDFGGDSLKLMQVALGEQIELVAAACAVMPAEARGNVQHRMSFYDDALRQLLRVGQFRGKRAMLAVPAAQSIMHQVQLPAKETGHMDSQVGLQLQQRLGVDPTRLVMRSFATPPGDHASTTEIVCVAASRDTVMRLIEFARQQRLEVAGMHAEPACVIRAFEHTQRRQDDENHATCYVDFGASCTRFMIAHGSKMVFAKKCAAAGDQLTRHFGDLAKLEFAQARRQRLAGRTLSDLSIAVDSPASDTQISTPAVQALLDDDQQMGTDPSPQRALTSMTAIDAVPPGAPWHEPTLNLLIEDLRLSIRYHNGRYASKPVERLVFVGGESNDHELCRHIARAMKMPAQLGDPLAQLRLSAESGATGVDVQLPQPGWSVPMGLCLSEANL